MAKYIDNQKFNEELRKFLIECDELEAKNEPIPAIPNYICESFMKIARGLGSTHRFSRYTYLDDMVSDAIEACVTKVRCFDYNKYSNPFAYFTQICWFAFIGCTGEEYKQKKIIYRACENMSLEDFNLNSDDEDVKNDYLEFLRENIDQRELDRIHQAETERKFVHRMLTKPKQKEKEDAPVVGNELVFE